MKHFKLYFMMIGAVLVLAGCGKEQRQVSETAEESAADETLNMQKSENSEPDTQDPGNTVQEKTSDPETEEASKETSEEVTEGQSDEAAGETEETAPEAPEGEEQNISEKLGFEKGSRITSQNGKTYIYQGNNEWLLEGTDAYFEAVDTDDGGFDLEWIKNHERSDSGQEEEGPFRFDSRVADFLNAGSYEEAVAGLTNVTQEKIGMQGDDEAYVLAYRITADNLPYSVTWGYYDAGDFTKGESYGLYEICGTMTEIFDGLTQETYTVEEFETLISGLGATDIKSRTYDEEFSINGVHMNNVNAYTRFRIGEYSFLAETVYGGSIDYNPRYDRVWIKRAEESDK